MSGALNTLISALPPHGNTGIMAANGDSLQFHEMGLDDRLLKAIAKLGWGHPTLIQVSVQGEAYCMCCVVLEEGPVYTTLW